ncbi:MAG TPA: hypothetical protein VF008_26825 [Niastella sp.]
MNNPFGLFLLLFVIVIIPTIFFLLTQQRTLEVIRLENRSMSPGQVWLQLIPFVGIIWQFIVISRISNSIRNELNTPMGDTVLTEHPVDYEFKPTYSTGISYTICFCISVVPIPILQGVAAVGGLILWIMYWNDLAHYKKLMFGRYPSVNS